MDKYENDFYETLYLKEAAHSIISSLVVATFRDDENITKESLRTQCHNYVGIYDVLCQSMFYEIALSDDKISENEKIYIQKVFNKGLQLFDVIDVDDWGTARDSGNVYVAINSALARYFDDVNALSKFNSVVGSVEDRRDYLFRITRDILANIAITDGDYTNEEYGLILNMILSYFNVNLYE